MAKHRGNLSAATAIGLLLVRRESEVAQLLSSDCLFGHEAGIVYAKPVRQKTASWVRGSWPSWSKFQIGACVLFRG